MRRKKNAPPGGTMVYQFGIPNMPQKVSEDAFEQLFLQNQYWNKLVETDKKYEARYNEIRESDERIGSINKEIETLAEQKNNLQKKIKAKRQKARGTVEYQDLREKIDKLKKEIASLRKRKKQLVRERKEEQRPLIQALGQERNQELKRLRQEFAAKGLYWGNYNAVSASFDTARSSVIKARSGGESAKLNFHRFDGTGRWTVQIQGGVTPEELFSGASNFIQIDPVSIEAWYHPTRSQRRKLCKTRGRIRIGSEGTKPKWLEFPVTMHREIPKHCRITYAQVTRKKMGWIWVWKLNLTVDKMKAPKPADSDDVIAFDLGWRKLEKGLRVAAWRDSKGRIGEVGLDESYLKVEKRLIGLQSVIDKHFNAIREKIIQWKQVGAFPEWLAEETKFIGHWRSAVKLVRLVLAMDDRPKSEKPSTEIIDELKQWQGRHLHLSTWLTNLRHKMQGRRREEFRIFAAWVADNYGVVVFEDFDISAVLQRKAPEEGVDHSNTMRRYAKTASPGTLRSEIVRACKKGGLEVVEIDPKNTTVTCIQCGEIIDADFAASIDVTCNHCGLSFDQDHGATENQLLRYYSERLAS